MFDCIVYDEYSNSALWNGYQMCWEVKNDACNGWVLSSKGSHKAY